MASRILLAIVAALGLAVCELAVASEGMNETQAVTFLAEDGGTISGIVYGKSARAVVLVHGGQYRKESWDSQARGLVEAGLMALAIDLRGFGSSTGPGQADPYTAPLYLDVLAAVRYLRANGARAVAVIGASMGGDGRRPTPSLWQRQERYRVWSCLALVLAINHPRALSCLSS